MSRHREKTESPIITVAEVDERLDDGDVSLIRQMLELTPTQRLRSLENFVNSIAALRNGRRVSSS